jgi:DUF971 family protein
LNEIPKLVELERTEQDAILRWGDGSEHTVSWKEIRYYCPCAKCSPSRGEEGRDQELRELIQSFRSEKPTVNVVGRYALSFEWTQGCSSGIHKFERLWDIANEKDPDRGQPYVHGAW